MKVFVRRLIYMRIMVIVADLLWLLLLFHIIVRIVALANATISIMVEHLCSTREDVNVMNLFDRFLQMKAKKKVFFRDLRIQEFHFQFPAVNVQQVAAIIKCK